MAKMKGTMVFLGVIAIAVILILGAISYQVFFVTPTSQSTTGGGVETPGGGVTGAGCNIATSVTTAVTDISNPGTAVTTSSVYRVNGVYTGSTAPTVVGTADILLNGSYDYLAKVQAGKKIECGPNLVTDSLYAYNNATLTYYRDDGLASLTQSSSNETTKTAGSTYNWKLHFQGNDKKSTGKMILIVEMSVPANVSALNLNGGQEVAVPNGYTRQLTNGYAKAWKLPAIVGTSPVDYMLSASASSAKVLNGQVYTTVIATEPFVETDGTFNDNGDAWNSLNVNKEHESYTKNFIIA